MPVAALPATAEVWMEPGVTPENLDDNVAGFYRRPKAPGKVALVLGAGNIAAIAPLDALYKLRKLLESRK